MFPRHFHNRLLLIAIALLTITGCAKEYSYERNQVTIDPPIVDDTVVQLPLPFPPCDLCKGMDGIELWKWNFKVGSTLLCGPSDTARINFARTGFTFFGPSECSKDSGLIIDAFFHSATFDRDQYNIKADEAVFYYYDNVKPSHVLISRNDKKFSVWIDSYIHRTRIATGKFSGYVYTEDGRATFITSGKFQIKLE